MKPCKDTTVESSFLSLYTNHFSIVVRSRNYEFVKSYSLYLLHEYIKTYEFVKRRYLNTVQCTICCSKSKGKCSVQNLKLNFVVTDMLVPFRRVENCLASSVHADQSQ
jgi:hypothetical protein